jgi:hypothetical protein
MCLVETASLDRDQLLTDHGMAIMEDAFKDANVRDYALKVVETETYTEATVTKMW